VTASADLPEPSRHRRALLGAVVFGMVPASLQGVDFKTLLDRGRPRAARMACTTFPRTPGGSARLDTWHATNAGPDNLRYRSRRRSRRLVCGSNN